MKKTFKQLFFAIFLMIKIVSFPLLAEPFVLTIDRAIELAIKSHPIIGTNDLESALINEDLNNRAFDWKFLPRGESAYTGGGEHSATGLTIGAGFDLAKRFQQGGNIVIGPTIIKTNDKYQTNFRFKIAQPLLKGFGKDYNLAGIHAAEFVTRSTYRKAQKMLSETIFKTIESVYELAKQNETICFLQDSLSSFEDFYKRAKIKEKIGFIDSIEIFKSELEYRQALEALEIANEKYQIVKENLCELLNLPYATEFELDISFEKTQMPLEQEISIKTALKNRVELQQAFDQIQENHRLLKIAKKNLLPAINFVVDYTNLCFDETFTGAFGSKREARWGFGFTTDGSFDRAAEKAGYQQATLSVENAENAFQEIKMGIIKEIKRQIQAITHLRKRIKFFEDQNKILENDVKLAKLKFYRGLIGHLELIQSEKGLKNSQLQLLNALAEHKVNEYRLLGIMGLLNETIFCENF